jgi:molecular chaperone DnaK
LDGILPAPRGVPQIDVKFAIDADGILTVTATDRATRKEQHITITGRSGLSKNEVDRLLREAEMHAEEDRVKREAVETRNMAESVTHQAEKLLRDNADKVPADLKSTIEGNIKRVRELLADPKADTAALAAAVSTLQQSLQKVGEAVYAAARAAGGPGAPGVGADSQPGDGTGSGKKPDDTVEGEFREV